MVVPLVAGRRPLVVLMSGAPGSGKSTLTDILGERLSIPVVHRDRVRGGLVRTFGPEFEGNPEVLSPKWLINIFRGSELFYKSLEFWVNSGVSVVGDMTIWRDVNEFDAIARLSPIAEMVNVHCRTINAAKRYEARPHTSPLTEKKVDFVVKLQSELFEPLDLGCPSIVVDTTDGYDPDIDDIVDEINHLYPIGLPLAP